MDVIVEFLQENWRFVAEIVLTVAVLLISLLRKKVNIPSIGLTQVLKSLPNYIREAERNYPEGHGAEKREMVLSWCKGDLAKFYADDAVVSFFMNIVDVALENILATPTKKGD